MNHHLSLYQDLIPWIRALSWRFGAPGHFALSPEELEAEGRVVFVKVINQVWDLTEPEISAIFKTALVNHFKSLLEKHRYTMKRGYTAAQDPESVHQLLPDSYLDLSDIAETVGYDAFVDVYYKEYVEAVRQVLKSFPDLAYLFETCIEVPKEVENMAYAESKRKARLARTQGHLLRNVEVVRIRQKHIAQYLGWSPYKMTQSLHQLREVVYNVIYS